MTDQPEQPKAEQPMYGERRPRPQYGEYATPQEQAKIIASSLPPVSSTLLPPAAPRSSSTPNASARARETPLSPTSGPRLRRWDLIITVALLGYATVNVVGELAARDTLEAIAKQFFISQGIGVFTPTAQASTLGAALNIITLALFLVTVLATVWRLRRGRVAFWVPIVGGAIATIVAIVFVVVLLQGDPAFTAYLNGIRK